LSSTQRLPSLDGLRGVSILLVLLAHSTEATNFPQGLWFLGELGELGVLIFFVISGFLITTLLMREKAETREISLRRFYIRRILRIFPVAYSYIGVVALLSAFGLVQLSQHDLAFALSYLTDYHSNCAWIFRHFWSLTVEEQFYLLWPPLVVVLGFEKSFTAAVVFLFLAQFGRSAMIWLVPAWTAAVGLLWGPQAIVVGCILAMSWERMRARKTLFASSFFSILLLLASTLQLYFWRIHSLWHVPRLVMSLLIGLCIFHCVETPENIIGKILNSRLLSAIGVLSYSLYVWQEMFLIYSPGTKTVIPWNLMATLGVAVVSYNLVERPFLRLKSRFAPSDPHTTKLKTIAATPGGVA
jgi:peptidoglycan/LPS O-acetylase OafA/YrhL